ncbi:hypothetical protein DUNSADRAFT_2647 [Dunaliella salina]|uniref:Encoded protein n=1 Tax=Dunaliella salina TaxID=3046 RepID=A0ABQ7H854_DUNSA|nr:hypothetical protein DUNSADRAFT_2647 [Dunaliella salina]|eukprot:KAF5843034.1 hypothetical protein DUNSADRAFT_2647 [Dunaliella salina]
MIAPGCLHRARTGCARSNLKHACRAYLMLFENSHLIACTCDCLHRACTGRAQFSAAWGMPAPASLVLHLIACSELAQTVLKSSSVHACTDLPGAVHHLIACT